MGNCMTFGLPDKPLEVFSEPHLAAMLIIAALCIIIILCGNILQKDTTGRYFRYTFAVIIFIQFALLYIWYGYSGELSIAVTLPLQLCDISIFLSIAVLITKNRYLFELLYFWGLGGATQAILTPDMGNYTFPHFIFYQFFLSHALIILTCIYMVIVEKFRPTFKSILRVFIITNIYAAFILPIDILTGGNYLFLMRKPPGGSLMNFLGPSPWYILSLEAIAVIMYMLLYLPFAFGRKTEKQESLSM
jgi:hypothetical integral membrane protein (TIGR02206 family)